MYNDVEKPEKAFTRVLGVVLFFTSVFSHLFATNITFTSFSYTVSSFDHEFTFLHQFNDEHIQNLVDRFQCFYKRYTQTCIDFVSFVKPSAKSPFPLARFVL